MTIHGSHPFLPAEGDRDPLRRWRGRMPAPVSVWTATAGGRPQGWTVSSFVLADGRPGEVVGLVDEDSDLADALRAGARFAVSLLGWRHRGLADVFAGLAPAPGGLFTQGSWRDTDWGPVLADGAGWLGARLLDQPDRAVEEQPGRQARDPQASRQPEPASRPDHAGWALLVRGVVEHLEPGELPPEGVLCSFRGRYSAIGATT